MSDILDLKSLRLKANLTQKEVADKLNRSQASICLLEKKIRFGTRLYKEEVQKLAKIYHCKMADIYKALEQNREKGGK